MSLAYERAAGVIETSCAAETADDPLHLDMEIGYLESRWLLLHHPGNPRLVAICDEGEPCGPEVVA